MQVQTLMEDFDGIGAGEEKPVVTFELGEGHVVGGVGFGWDDLDGGDEDRRCAESFELGREVGGLVAGAGYEDAFVVEGHLVVIVVGEMGYAERHKRLDDLDICVLNLGSCSLILVSRNLGSDERQSRGFALTLRKERSCLRFHLQPSLR